MENISTDPKQMKTHYNNLNHMKLQSLVEKLLNVNILIQSNILQDPLELFEITSLDLKNFKQILCYLEKNFVIENVISIAKSKYKIDPLTNIKDNTGLLTDSDRAVFTKYFILLISFATHYQDYMKPGTMNWLERVFLLFKLIKKLFFDEILLENEIGLILKFLLILSLSNSKNLLYETENKTGKILTNLPFIWITVAFLSSLEEIQITSPIKEEKVNVLIDDILLFLNEKILCNFNNITILSDSNKFLDMLHILKIGRLQDHVKFNTVSIIAKIYEGNYSYKVVKWLIGNVKETLVRFSKISVSQLQKDMQVLNGEIELLKELNHIENEKIYKDPFVVENGFAMNNNMKSGIILKKILTFPKKGYTLIFSFKFMPISHENQNRRYSLISFAKENPELLTKETILSFATLMIYIENSKLVICSNELWETNFEIKPYVTYLLYISQNEPGLFKKGKSEMVVTINKLHSLSTYLSYPSNCKVLIAGYSPKFDETKNKLINDFQFTGILGTILLFNELFGKNFIENVFNLRGLYGRMLTIQGYDTSYIDQFNIYPKDSDYSKAVDYFRKYTYDRIDQKVHLLISSKPIMRFNRSKKRRYKENYLQIANKNLLLLIHYRYFELMVPPNPFNNATYAFNYNLTANEFLKFKGLKLLYLHLESLRQILSRITREEEDIDKEMTNEIIEQMSTENILEYGLDVIEMGDINNMINDLNALFYTMTQLIHQGSTFMCLLKYLCNFHMKEDLSICKELRNKFIYFLVDIRLYDLWDFPQLESLVTIINSCLLRNPEGLLTKSLIRSIMNFAYVFDLHVAIRDDTKREMRGFKKKLSQFLVDILRISIERGMNEVFNEYFTLCANEKNIPKLYRLLKILFIAPANPKDIVNILHTDRKRHQEFKDFFLSLIDSLEFNFFEKMKIHHSSFTVNTTINIVMESSSNDMRIIELVKALSIRFLDDFYYDEQLRNNSVTCSSKLHCKLNYINGIIEKIIPSPYTLRSVVLTAFPFLNAKEKIEFIRDKQRKDNITLTPEWMCNFDCENLHFLKVIVRLLERISRQDYSTIFSNSLLLMHSGYSMMRTILFHILSRYEEKQDDNECKCEFMYIFESRSICSQFFLNCLGSFWLLERKEDESRKINTSNEEFILSSEYDTSQLKGKIQSDILLIITHTINLHTNPFFYNLIFNLFWDETDEKFMIDMIQTIILTLSQYSSNNDGMIRQIYSNHKNLICLFYQMIFSNKKELFRNKRFEAIFIPYLMSLSSNPIVLVKCSINEENPERQQSCKAKTILEILFEMYIQLNIQLNDSKYITLLDNLIFVSMTNTKTLFYYLDLLDHKKAVPKKIAIKFNLNHDKLSWVKEQSTFCYSTSYFFLVKIFVYLNRIEFYYSKNNEKRFQHLFEFLTTLAEATSNDALKIYQKCKRTKFIEMKSSLYKELKNLIESFYILENSFIMLKMKFDEIITKYHNDSKKYTRIIFNTENKKENGLLQVNLGEDIISETNIDECSSYDPCSRSESCSENILVRLSEKKMATCNQMLISDKESEVSFSEISSDGIMINLKTDLLMKDFGVYFKDIYFSNELFLELQNYFHYIFHLPRCNLLQFPVKIKNFLCPNYYRVFLTQDSNFFLNPPKYFQEFNDHKLLRNIQLSPIILHLNTKPIQEYPCELITLKGSVPGKMFIMKDYILFQNRKGDSKLDDQNYFLFSSLNIIDREKQVIIFYRDISEILNRRFLYMWQANEIFLSTGRSYYFNFFHSRANEAFLNQMREMFEGKLNVIANSQKYFKICEYTRKWVNMEIGNVEYLLLLNKYSGRSFHDVNQYPILPWVLSNYLNPEGKQFLRNFAYPMSAQDEDNRKDAIRHYEEDQTINSGKWKSHFQSHYSTQAHVSYYLKRFSPFAFQQNSQMLESLDNLRQFNDNRELIPEIAFSSEFLLNLNCYDFPSDNNNLHRINHVGLPPWCKNPMEFVYYNRLMFESKEVSAVLNLWIDNIFGVNQIAKSKESCNIFTKYSYEQMVNLEKKIEKYKQQHLDNMEIRKKIHNKITRIFNSGQTPVKLFDERHSKKLKVKQTKDKDIDDEFVNLSQLFWKKENKVVEKFSRGVVYFFYTETFLTVLNGDRELEIFDKKSFKKKLKIRLKHFSFLTKLEWNKTLNLIYKPGYIFLELRNCTYFVFVRHIDNSIKIYNSEGNIQNILYDSFILAIVKVNDDKFYTGHDNGKIVEWGVNYAKNGDISIIPSRDLIAHEGGVNAIFINCKLNVIVSGGEDGFVLVRNMYNFELLSSIKIDERSLKIVDVKISNFDMLYIMAYDSNKNIFVLFGYTINGICFNQREGMFTNFEFSPSGRLIVGLFDVNQVEVWDCVDFSKCIFVKALELETCMTYFTLVHRQSLLNCGDKNGGLLTLHLHPHEMQYFS